MKFLGQNELKVAEEVLGSHLPRSLQKGDLFKDICVFAKGDGPLRELLGDDGVLNWEQYFCLGADSSHEETVMGVAAERGVCGKRVTLCHMLFLKDPSHLPTADRSPLRISSLDESHVDLVNKMWKFGSGEHSVQMIRNMIRHFPSCCLWDEQGCVAAWILTYPSGAMGMLYTVPEHRGKGYAKLVISTMSRRLQAQGCPVYCFVEEENQLSYRIFRNLGFTEDPAYRAAWFQFHHL